jgi:hypothetical protein
MMDSSSRTASTKKSVDTKGVIEEQTHDRSDSFVAEQSARRGSNDDGVGVGVVKAEVQHWCQHQREWQ